MKRYASVTLLAAVLGGCTGDLLSAGADGADGGSDTSVAATSSATTLATMGSLIDAFAMDAEYLYFTAEDGSLYRLAKTGATAPEVLAPAATSGSVYTEGIALDDGTVYWTALGDGIQTGAVLSVAKTGGSPTAIATELARPMGIAVDDANVYWSDQGAPPPLTGSNSLNPPKGAAILSAPKAGGTLTVLVTNPTVPDAVALDATGVVWHEQQSILRVPKTGGTSTTLSHTSIPWACSNLVVSGSTLYWAADQGGWSLQSVVTSGGPVSTLVASIDPPGSISLVGTSLFWNVSSGSTVGAILAASTAGSFPPMAAASADVVPQSTGEQATFFLADASAFYWVESWGTPDASAPTVAIRVLGR